MTPPSTSAFVAHDAKAHVKSILSKVPILKKVSYCYKITLSKVRIWSQKECCLPFQVHNEVLTRNPSI